MPRYHDRVLALGFTGSGKSELLNCMFTELRVQKVLVDTKNEFAIEVPDGEGGRRRVEPARSVAELDWSEPVLHYIDSTGTADEFDELFAACFRRRQLVVCVHELSDLCEYQPGRTPRHVNGYLSKGRAHGLGLLGGSQRPVNMPTRGRSEADHVYIFVPRLTPQDHAVVAETIGRPKDELAAVIDETHAQLGDYAHLHFDRRSRELHAIPPLPEHLRRRNIVQRTTVL